MFVVPADGRFAPENDYNWNRPENRIMLEWLRRKFGPAAVAYDAGDSDPDIDAYRKLRDDYRKKEQKAWEETVGRERQREREREAQRRQADTERAASEAKQREAKTREVRDEARAAAKRAKELEDRRRQRLDDAERAGADAERLGEAARAARDAQRLQKEATAERARAEVAERRAQQLAREGEVILEAERKRNEIREATREVVEQDRQRVFRETSGYRHPTRGKYPSISHAAGGLTSNRRLSLRNNAMLKR